MLKIFYSLLTLSIISNQLHAGLILRAGQAARGSVKNYFNSAALRWSNLGENRAKLRELQAKADSLRPKAQLYKQNMEKFSEKFTQTQPQSFKGWRIDNLQQHLNELQSGADSANAEVSHYQDLIENPTYDVITTNRKDGTKTVKKVHRYTVPPTEQLSKAQKLAEAANKKVADFEKAMPDLQKELDVINQDKAAADELQKILLTDLPRVEQAIAVENPMLRGTHTVFNPGTYFRRSLKSAGAPEHGEGAQQNINATQPSSSSTWQKYLAGALGAGAVAGAAGYTLHDREALERHQARREEARQNPFDRK